MKKILKRIAAITFLEGILIFLIVAINFNYGDIVDIRLNFFAVEIFGHIYFAYIINRNEKQRMPELDV